MKNTFGDSLKYIGTTTDFQTETEQIRDVDVMVVFESMSESTIAYSWKIISMLHAKYNIFIDARLFEKKKLDNIPEVNQYLLQHCLEDLFEENPFKNFEISNEDLRIHCKERIKKQKEEIVKIIPRIAGDSNQVSKIAQCVYDAIRAFLIIEGTPIADKKRAHDRVIEKYPRFSLLEDIYKAYLEPHSVVDITGFILDSLALVNQLVYKSAKKTTHNEVLLINTPSSFISHPRNDYLKYDHNMPLGLICLSAYLKQQGIKVNVLDAYAENLDVLSIIDRIFNEKEVPKIIGINSSSPNIHIVHRIAHYIKLVNEDIIVVCGGSHATLATEHTLSTGDIDYVVAGEGEIPLFKIAEKAFNGEKANDIPGVYYKSSDKILGLPNKEFLEVSKLPAPDFDSLPLDKYFYHKKRVYIHTSRGCKCKCIFCSVPRMCDENIRVFPIETIEAHLEKILEKHNPEEFQIVDDNFSYGKGRLIHQFCRSIEQRKWNFKWKCQVRADQLDEGIIKQMAKSGCFEIDMGIESGDPEIQKHIRKNLDLEKTKKIVSIIHQSGIKSKAFFMIGFPPESYEQIKNTINYAIALKKEGLTDLAIFPVMPFPGTDISILTG
ncbi:MAG TPA: radical SAM protein, partial [Candidatus Kapabacteria bacterium]|nr:radical SAM protein [Candidatus Kapabacteria bacterium]